jgi:uncharacterized protein (DUF111 family)
MRILYFDCFSGAAGDMVVGALIDAGVPLAELRRALGSLAIEAETVWTERVVRAGISATKFCVRGEEAGNPGRHPHRHLKGINVLIDRSALSDAGRARAKSLFERLGEAEAAIHDTTLEKVHLHEVGALDSIIDIVGAVFALEWLGIEEVVASPLNVGSGTVRTAHGLYPVPVPAAMRLLAGVPIYAGDQQAELVTPTAWFRPCVCHRSGTGPARGTSAIFRTCCACSSARRRQPPCRLTIPGEGTGSSSSSARSTT